jgi:ABC-type uncharacterized transport system permease subunit
MSDRIAQAETRAELARKRLAGTALTLRDRLKPAALIEDGVQALGAQASKTALTVKRKPLVAVTAAVVAGVAFALSRKRVPLAPGKKTRKLTVGQVANGVIFAARLVSMLRRTPNP